MVQNSCIKEVDLVMRTAMESILSFFAIVCVSDVLKNSTQELGYEVDDASFSTLLLLWSTRERAESCPCAAWDHQSDV